MIEEMRKTENINLRKLIFKLMNTSFCSIEQNEKQRINQIKDTRKKNNQNIYLFIYFF